MSPGPLKKMGGIFMFEEPTRQILFKAIEELQNEFDMKIQKVMELESIKKECEKIKSHIQQIKDWIADESEIDFSAGLEPSLPKEVPVHKGLSWIFDDYGRQMKLKELVDAFRKKNWKLSKTNPEEVIRSSMKRHPELFRKVGRGTWEKTQRTAYSSIKDNLQLSG